MATTQCRDYIFADIGVSAVFFVSKSSLYCRYSFVNIFYNCKTVCMQILERIITSLKAMGRQYQFISYPILNLKWYTLFISKGYLNTYVYGN